MYYSALHGITMLTTVKDTITFRMDSHKRDALDAIAKELDRDRSYILNAAIENYIEMYQWQIGEINSAIEEADTGDFVSEEEVDAVFGRLMNAS